MAGHRSAYRRWLKNQEGFVTSFKLFQLDYDKPLIYLVENLSCQNKEELNARERFYIEINDCVNKNIPGRTMKEYYEQNIVKVKEKNKLYRDQNVVGIKDQKKRWYEQNPDKVKEYQKQYSKQYYEKNLDKIKEKNKQYYEKTKHHNT
jgi:hypothetical protein